MRVSLIIFFIGFLTIAPSIWVGIKYFDGKVTDQPYETGLNYDADKKFIKDNGLELNILSNTKTEDKVNLKFVLSENNTPVDGAQFFITRPASDKEMMKIEADETDGTYASAFTLNNQGFFILKAKGTVKGKEINLQKSFYIN